MLRRFLIKTKKKKTSAQIKKDLSEKKQEQPNSSTSSRFTHPDTIWKNIALDEFKKRQNLAKKREEFLKKFKKPDLVPQEPELA